MKLGLNVHWKLPLDRRDDMRKAIADFESEKFPLRIEIIEDRTTGYAAVSEIIEQWYQLNGYGDLEKCVRFAKMLLKLI